jgi:hypothetical protein
MSTSSQNNATVVDSCTKRLQALSAYVDAKAQISIDGTKLKASQVIAIYQSCLDSRAALATKRAETKAAMATRASAEAARRRADRAVKAWVVNEFGERSASALGFGFAPPKKATRTVESKVNAVALAKATRAARHTMGKKQKSLIKGTVVVPVAPANPAITPAGASPAGQPCDARRSGGGAAACDVHRSGGGAAGADADGQRRPGARGRCVRKRCLGPLARSAAGPNSTRGVQLPAGPPSRTPDRGRSGEEDHEHRRTNVTERAAP